MLFKDNKVRCVKVTPELLMGLMVMDEIHSQQFGKPMVITSLNDGYHMSYSLHYQGKAADVRAKDKSIDEVRSFVSKCKLFLDDDFDIVIEDEGLENFHIHLEYDPD